MNCLPPHFPSPPGPLPENGPARASELRTPSARTQDTTKPGAVFGIAPKAQHISPPGARRLRSKLHADYPRQNESTRAQAEHGVPITEKASASAIDSVINFAHTEGYISDNECARLQQKGPMERLKALIGIVRERSLQAMSLLKNAEPGTPAHAEARQIADGLAALDVRLGDLDRFVRTMEEVARTSPARQGEPGKTKNDAATPRQPSPNASFFNSANGNQPSSTPPASLHDYAPKSHGDPQLDMLRQMQQQINPVLRNFFEISDAVFLNLGSSVFG